MLSVDAFSERVVDSTATRTALQLADVVVASLFRNAMSTSSSERDRMRDPSLESVGHLAISRKLLVKPSRCAHGICFEWATVPALSSFVRAEPVADLRVSSCV
jgi:hypothetical protein